MAATATKTKSKRTAGAWMTDSHKAALARGRNESRAVSNYLKALDTNKPRRGRPRTVETVEARLAAVEQAIPEASPIEKLNLAQERVDLLAERDRLADAPDLTAVEAEFAKHAKGYSERKGITYGVWRQSGVPADVLAKAGITRSNS